MNEIYESNSHKARARDAAEAAEKEKKVEKVVSGPVKVRKKNEIHKLADVFIAEDASNVKSYIFTDVVVPAIKKLVSDIFTDGLNMLLYGGTNRGERKSTSSYVSYNKYSDRDRGVGRNYEATRTRTSYSHNDIVLDNRGEAEAVLNQMDDIIETYGFVTVADLYDLVGEAANYTDQKYGWTNIRNAEPVRVRDGYLLKLPKALPID